MDRPRIAIFDTEADGKMPGGIILRYLLRDVTRVTLTEGKISYKPFLTPLMFEILSLPTTDYRFLKNRVIYCYTNIYRPI